MKNIWILTEEQPKTNVIQIILEKVAIDKKLNFKIKNLQIIPLSTPEGKFDFVYKVTGVSSSFFKDIFIKIASGNSSFVDFLVFIQENVPDQKSIPLYAIEETKTDDSESRNTGVYQRCSKFVYVDFYYPGIKKIMLYNLQIKQKEKPTATNIFGSRMLSTIGVEVIGKNIDSNTMKPFSSLDELAQTKNLMRMPPKGNVPIKIEILPKQIRISGRLYKSGGLNHDPNIGALTIMALCIRKWDKKKNIVITKHGLTQKNVGRNNKFIQIAKRLNISLDGLNIPKTVAHDKYWHYEHSKEKMATILLHVLLLTFTKAMVIYANHGGSERSYFIDKLQRPIVINKYQKDKKEIYKSGDKTAIIHLPDLIVFDPSRKEVINIEGKKYTTRKIGIKELNNYDYIEKEIIKPSYSPKTIIRTVVVFGGKAKLIQEKKISFLLNDNGEVILSDDAPKIFKEAVNRWLSTK